MFQTLYFPFIFFHVDFSLLKCMRTSLNPYYVTYYINESLLRSYQMQFLRHIIFMSLFILSIKMMNGVESVIEFYNQITLKNTLRFDTY